MPMLPVGGWGIFGRVKDVMGILQRGLAAGSRGIVDSGAARSLLAISVALVMAALLAWWTAPSAAGQTTTLAPEEVVTKEQRQAFRATVEKTKSPVPEEAERARRVLERSFLTGAPRVAPVLLRASLVGTASYVWYHNYVTLREGLSSGEVIEVHSNLESRLADGAIVTRGENANGTRGATSVLIAYRYEVTGHWFGDYNHANFYAKMVSVPGTFVCGTSYCSSEGGTLNGVPVTYDTGKYITSVDGRVSASKASLDDGTFLGYAVYEDEWIGKGVTNYGSAIDLEMTDEVPYGTYKWRTIVDNCPYVGCRSELRPPTVNVGATEIVPANPSPPKGSFVASPQETRRLYEALTKDPEYDPSWAKPWLREDFRAPSDPLQREALWGPVVGTWTTPGGGECKEYEYGAKLCDHPGGSTFVWIVKDWAAWMQHGDGSKNSFSRHGDRPPPPTSGGSGGISEPSRPLDALTFDEANGMANHAFERLAEERQQGRPEDHMIPGIDMSDPENPWELQDYVYSTIDLVERSGRNFAFGGRFEGPYYGETVTYGSNAGKRKKAYWDNEKQVLIVRDPTNPDGGSVFKSTPEYRAEHFPDTWKP